MNSRDDQSVLPSPSGPVLCSTGCGFFGNPNTDNLCSKCNNDRKRRQAAADSAATSSSPATLASASPATSTPSPALVSTSSPAISTSSPATPTLAPLSISEPTASSTSSPVDAAVILSPVPSSTAPATAAATSSPVDAPPSTSTSSATPKKKLNRCGICSKKVGITYFNCRCDDTLLLCSAHRLPHQHDCKFDLKKLHTANLTKANPEIVKAKMEKI